MTHSKRAVVSFIYYRTLTSRNLIIKPKFFEFYKTSIMPQGKLKVKAKVPKSVEAKRKAKKGPAISKRGSAPVAAKKAKKVEAQKLKKIITKSVNAAAEEEIRAIAMDGKKSVLSKKGSSTLKAAPKTKRGKKK